MSTTNPSTSAPANVASLAQSSQPVPIPVTSQPLATTANVNINRLGFFLDGWGDLMENMGDKAEIVQQEVHNQLMNRDMPDIKVKAVKGHVGIGSQVTGKTRTYLLTTTHPGATTTISVSKHGKDLFVSWATFIKRIPNWFVLGVILLFAGFMGVGAGGTVIAAGAGINRAAYDIQSESFFGGFEEESDIEPLLRPLQIAFFAFIWGLTTTIMWFIGITFMCMVVGYYMLQDPLFLLTVRPNMFDAEDIAAMSLSAHKSLLKALDKIGVDTSKLRLKQDFKRGTRTATI